jgi:hypothetical protein
MSEEKNNKRIYQLIKFIDENEASAITGNRHASHADAVTEFKELNPNTDPKDEIEVLVGEYKELDNSRVEWIADYTLDKCQVFP